MNGLITYIVAHAGLAHWFAFGAILLAGVGVPVSIDLVLLICAILAATVIPENLWILFIFCTLGCLFAAWIAYGMGRILGKTLLQLSFFRKVVPQKKLDQAKNFYEKHGLATLMICRFIPFGIRNCLFISAGMSKMSFVKFALRDALACLTWCSLAFFLFYSLGQNYQLLYHYVKTFNIVIFSLFGIASIVFIWVKRKKALRRAAAKEIS
jgi:membrane protein DedA with SNARE-associated domain